MGRVIALHARLTGPHYQTNRLRFGTEWTARYFPKDFLEFSEYGRNPDCARGSWLLLSVGIGALMWMTLAAVFL